jgi:hypothetical protein
MHNVQLLHPCAHLPNTLKGKLGPGNGCHQRGAQVAKGERLVIRTPVIRSDHNLQPAVNIRHHDSGMAAEPPSTPARSHKQRPSHTAPPRV